MRSYSDGLGRSWVVDVTVATRDRLWAVCGCDLFDAVDDEKAAKLWGYLQWPPNLVRALWVIAEPSARAAGVDEDSFRAGHSGDVFDAAAEALEGAIIDFFPRAQRLILTAAAGARREAELEAIEAYKRLIESPQLRAKLRDELVATEAGIRARIGLLPPTSSNSAINSPG